MLFVSHDRYFVNRVADHLLLIEPGRVRVVEGNYETLPDAVGPRAAAAEDRTAAGSRKSQRTTGTPSCGSSEKPASAAKRSAAKRRFPYRKVADMEEEILRAGERASRNCSASLRSRKILRNGERMRTIKVQIAEEQAAVKTLYSTGKKPSS